MQFGTTARTSPRYEFPGVDYPHIALLLNVGFARRHNVSDVINMFQRVVTRLAAADDVRR